jgi:hypothetical protein
VSLPSRRASYLSIPMAFKKTSRGPLDARSDLIPSVFIRAQTAHWLVSFMDYDVGYFDLETRVLEPLDNPFGPKV